MNMLYCCVCHQGMLPEVAKLHDGRYYCLRHWQEAQTAHDFTSPCEYCGLPTERVYCSNDCMDADGRCINGHE